MGIIDLVLEKELSREGSLYVIVEFIFWRIPMKMQILQGYICICIRILNICNTSLQYNLFTLQSNVPKGKKVNDQNSLNRSCLCNNDSLVIFPPPFCAEEVS